MRRLRALMRKELTHMRRDPRTVVMIFVMPILQLLLLGYATNTDVKNVSTVVFDQDNSRASRSLLATYRATGYFALDYLAFGETDATRLIEGARRAWPSSSHPIMRANWRPAIPSPWPC